MGLTEVLRNVSKIKEMELLVNLRHRIRSSLGQTTFIPNILPKQQLHGFSSRMVTAGFLKEWKWS